jgi:hypothetical protein
VAAVLFAASVVLLASFAWYQVRAWAFDWIEGRRLDRAIAGARAGEVEPGAATAAEPGAVLGRIEIPAAGISALVVEGTGTAQLAVGVGRIPGTARVGVPRTVWRAGDRDQ